MALMNSISFSELSFSQIDGSAIRRLPLAFRAVAARQACSWRRRLMIPMATEGVIGSDHATFLRAVTGRGFVGTPIEVSSLPPRSSHTLWERTAYYNIRVYFGKPWQTTGWARSQE